MYWGLETDTYNGSRETGIFREPLYKLLMFINLLVLSSCATSPGETPLTLDAVAWQASVEITEANVSGTFAIVNIVSLSKELSLQITRLLENGLVRNKALILVTRQKIATVLDEQQFGASGYVDDNSAQKIGRILGAKYVLNGELIKPEERYFLNIQVLETESARIICSNTFEMNLPALKSDLRSGGVSSKRC
jgi:TolB-like protein